MNGKLYVGNLPNSTTQDELKALFAHAGEVTAAEIIKDRKNGFPKGFAFITLSIQNEADKAVSMFNSYILRDHVLEVRLARLGEQNEI